MSNFYLLILIFFIHMLFRTLLNLHLLIHLPKIPSLFLQLLIILPVVKIRPQQLLVNTKQLLPVLVYVLQLMKLQHLSTLLLKVIWLGIGGRFLCFLWRLCSLWGLLTGGGVGWVVLGS